MVARQVVSLRLDEELLGWATEYAKARGVPRTELLEAGLRSFRSDCEGGVPGLREMAARQSSVPDPEGVGDCPDRPGSLGHVWRMDSERVNRCRFCGMLGREFLQRASAERAEVFARLRTPGSAKGARSKG